MEGLVDGYNSKNFSVLEAFSFLLDYGLNWLSRNNTKALHHQLTKRELKMVQEKAVHRLHEEIVQFEKSTEDMKLLKRVSKDLKNFRKMIKLKKYD